MFMPFLKSELFKVSKMLSTYILPLILIVVILINGVLLLKIDMFTALGLDRDQYDQLVEDGNSIEGISESFQMGFEAGLDAGEAMYDEENPEEITIPSLWGEGIYYHEDVDSLFQQNVATLTAILFISIFVGIYIGDNYSYKSDKNIVMACNKRTLITVVRMIVIALYTLVIHVITWLGALLNAALMAESVKLHPDKSTVIYFIVSYVLTLAFGYIVMFITHALRSKAAGITIGVILSSGMLTMVVTLATMIVKNYLPVPDDFSFANYFLSQNLAVIGFQSTGAEVIRALICSIVYSAIATVGSIFVINKRDIV